MVRLHLLGFTHDLKGVVFSQRRGGKTATFWIPVDDTFLDAIDKLQRARRETENQRKGRAAGRTKETATRERDRDRGDRALPPVGRSQSASQLPASEIQQLLRQGRSVNAVVEASKAPRAWVERLLEPVMTERGGVIRLAQRATMSRARLGRSGLPVGEAVVRNLESRRATADTIEGLDDAWDARAQQSGRWRIWVKFGHRGKRRTAEWEFRKDTREIHPRNRLGAQLGWWPPDADAKAPVEPAEPDEPEAGTSDESAAPPRRRKPRRKAAAKRRKPAHPSRPRARPTKRSPKRSPKRTAKRAPKRSPGRRSAAKRPARRRRP